MTTVLERPAAEAGLSAAQRLRSQTAAARLSFTWFGSRKSLSGDQKARAADAFGAEHDSLSASKRLLDARHPAYKAVTAVKTRITSYWKGVSLPFPEPGVRLIRQSQISTFNEQMTEFQEDLAEAARRLAEQAFLEELEGLVAHLTERLSGQSDGRPKIFRDSAVENLTEFFERFRRLNIGSSEQLDELVGQCRQIVGGVEPQTLRDNSVLRTSVAAELGQVQGVLDTLLVDRPRRNILRRPR